MPREPVDVFVLGCVPYREAWAWQRTLQAHLVAAKRAATPSRPRLAMLVLEHPPVFTLGAGADASHVLDTEAGLQAAGADLVAVDRGGDVTFHGPGQLVVYPLLDLDRLATPEGEPLRDLHRYLRELEEAVVRTCAAWNVVAGRVAGRTGVWVGPDRRGPERKVCAMGVRCSRWVTMHGLALNLTTDLSWFGRIVPCGIADRDVTSLAVETGQPVEADAVYEMLTTHLADRLGLEATVYRGTEAQAALDARLAAAAAAGVSV